MEALAAAGGVFVTRNVPSGIAAFLARAASNYVTGADIRVDGGLMWGA